MIKKFVEKFNREREIYLRIKARPGAGRTAVKQILCDEDGEIIKLDLAAPAVKGKANAELVKFLAGQFDVPKNNVKIIGGAGDRLKLIKITNKQ